jgi:hypothetical protein
MLNICGLLETTNSSGSALTSERPWTMSYVETMAFRRIIEDEQPTTRTAWMARLLECSTEQIDEIILRTTITLT